ncbi:Protein of unknown function [Gryllus bimaculatus]|nr:Protein of unknown function [Gryllus bimaculatus]
MRIRGTAAGQQENDDTQISDCEWPLGSSGRTESQYIYTKATPAMPPMTYAGAQKQ